MQEPNYKVIEDMFRNVLDTLKRKNHDYDNAFAKACDEFGNMYAVSKIYEKYSRIKKLVNTDPLVRGETLEDALLDIIGYASLLYERVYFVPMTGNWLYRGDIVTIDPVKEDIRYTDGRLIIDANTVKNLCQNDTYEYDVYLDCESDIEPFKTVVSMLVESHQGKYDFHNLHIHVCNHGTAET